MIDLSAYSCSLTLRRENQQQRKTLLNSNEQRTGSSEQGQVFAFE